MCCRLLYLVGQLGPGGLERQLCYLLQAMNRECYRPAVAVWNYNEADPYVSEIQKLKVPLHCFPNLASAGAKLAAFRRLVGQLRPEVVHSYSFYTNFAAYWGLWGRRGVSIGSIRSDFTFELQTGGAWLGRLSARWPGTQIANSFAAQQNVRRSKSPFVPRQLLVVRNGLDLRRFSMFPLSPSRPARILGIGSLLSLKRWDRLLVAVQALKQSGLSFMVRLVGDGPLKGLLMQQAQAVGISDRVEFIGHSNRIPELLEDSTFLVHTSDVEGCPNAIMEAMACGRAVVATAVGDVPSLVEDGKTGFVVGCEDSAMLVKRMATLIRDPELCRQMGERARAKAEAEFAFDRLVSETLSAYRAAGWKAILT